MTSRASRKTSAPQFPNFELHLEGWGRLVAVCGNWRKRQPSLRSVISPACVFGDGRVRAAAVACGRRIVQPKAAVQGQDAELGEPIEQRVRSI
jgi:hypothetical protein